MSKRMRTSFSDSPRHLLVKLELETLKNVVPHSVATALAKRVLPVPGGPTIKTPYNTIQAKQIYTNDSIIDKKRSYVLQLYSHFRSSTIHISSSRNILSCRMRSRERRLTLITTRLTNFKLIQRCPSSPNYTECCHIFKWLPGSSCHGFGTKTIYRLHWHLIWELLLHRYLLLEWTCYFLPSYRCYWCHGTKWRPHKNCYGSCGWDIDEAIRRRLEKRICIPCQAVRYPLRCTLLSHAQ